VVHGGEQRAVKVNCGLASGRRPHLHVRRFTQLHDGHDKAGHVATDEHGHHQQEHRRNVQFAFLISLNCSGVSRQNDNNALDSFLF
jgi:hypothetical protein